MHFLLYDYAAILLYILYTIHLHLIIYIWFISPSLIWMFFSTKSFPFAQVQWRYYDLPGRSSLFLRLSRWSNKPWHTVGRKKPLEERPFLGYVVWIHPVFQLIYDIYDFLKWYNDIQQQPWDTLPKHGGFIAFHSHKLHIRTFRMPSNTPLKPTGWSTGQKKCSTSSKPHCHGS